MNLFCFTLEGSTESMYEPSHSLKEERPMFQCSPAVLRRRPEWGGSDPSINCSKSQSTKIKRNHVKSCFVTSALDCETIDIHRACWISSADKKDQAHQKRVPNKDMCKTSGDTAKTPGMDHESIKTDPTLQASKTAADTAESIKARSLKKLQNLMPTTKGGQQRASGKERSVSEDYDHLTDIYNPVLTCIGLGKREKKSSVPSPSPQQSDSLSHEHSEVETVWSPLESPCELWRPPHQSCPEAGHTSRHEMWECGSPLSLSRTAAWDRFESLIQELDSKEPDPGLPHLVRSITDLDFHQDEMNPVRGSNLTCLKEEAEVKSQKDRKQIKTDDAKSINVKQNLHGRDLTKRHSNSMESLYSSGQSSSSGVTSGSNCSSNRASLRLDEELSSPRTFCGRARVHTEFVPSPYDTDSLRLKVGDVIDIISKPAMGTWTGMLNYKTGYFKFIYVDVLKEEPITGDSTYVHDFLQRFDLEEYSSTLVSHGYKAFEDLVRLRERDLTELKVTDPKHRRRLLFAVSTLRPLHPDNQEAADVKNCPRDSGCGMLSPDNAAELYSPSEYTDLVTVC
ncbi:SAM domain-containing protein SAMSN-1b [Eucyclogobius newberryi]|uniref:SAM domain-containing protein SAMSN-1b n=1 Tax=Eucyclogobius newberryi TaxID=166745 RepID=UPI003B5BA4FD